MISIKFKDPLKLSKAVSIAHWKLKSLKTQCGVANFLGSLLHPQSKIPTYSISMFQEADQPLCVVRLNEHTHDTLTYFDNWQKYRRIEGNLKKPKR